jgi:hypothetical protein
MKLSELNILDIGNKYGLVGAVYGNEDRTFLCMFPGQDIATTEVLDMDLEDWKKFLRQSDLLETEVLQKTEHGQLAKAILRKTQRLIEARVSWGVFRRDGYKCCYCGEDGVPLTVDHLVLWEEGGPSIPENLLTACRKCNKARGRIQFKDWLEHKYYKRVSMNIGVTRRGLNRKLVATLDAIPRVHSERKTRK